MLHSRLMSSSQTLSLSFSFALVELPTTGSPAQFIKNYAHNRCIRFVSRAAGFLGALVSYALAAPCENTRLCRMCNLWLPSDGPAGIRGDLNTQHNTKPSRASNSIRIHKFYITANGSTPTRSESVCVQLGGSTLLHVIGGTHSFVEDPPTQMVRNCLITPPGNSRLVHHRLAI